MVTITLFIMLLLVLLFIIYNCINQFNFKGSNSAAMTFLLKDMKSSTWHCFLYKQKIMTLNKKKNERAREIAKLKTENISKAPS